MLVQQRLATTPVRQIEVNYLYTMLENLKAANEKRQPKSQSTAHAVCGTAEQSAVAGNCSGDVGSVLACSSVLHQ